MVSAKETAEEQLLRMIEGAATPTPPKRPAPRFSIGPWLPQAQRFLDQVRQRLSGPMNRKAPSDVFLWQLQFAGRIFWIVLAGLGIYLIVDAWVLQPAMPTLGIPPSPSTAPSGTPETSASPMDPLEERAKEYRDTLASRNPFRLATTHVINRATGETVKTKLFDLTSSWIIVGINRGKVPEALVEDGEEKRTYFVKVGDQIKGVTVKAIDQAGVTVMYEGEETTLH